MMPHTSASLRAVGYRRFLARSDSQFLAGDVSVCYNGHGKLLSRYCPGSVRATRDRGSVVGPDASRA
jgi:hypothetical protein